MACHDHHVLNVHSNYSDRQIVALNKGVNQERGIARDTVRDAQFIMYGGEERAKDYMMHRGHMRSGVKLSQTACRGAAEAATAHAQWP